MFFIDIGDDVFCAQKLFSDGGHRCSQSGGQQAPLPGTRHHHAQLVRATVCQWLDHAEADGGVVVASYQEQWRGCMPV